MNSQIKLTFLPASCTLCTTIIGNSSSPALQNKSRSELGWNVSSYPIPKFFTLQLTNSTCFSQQSVTDGSGAVLSLRLALQMVQTRDATHSICVALPRGSHCLCPAQRSSEAHSSPKSLPSNSQRTPGRAKGSSVLVFHERYWGGNSLNVPAGLNWRQNLNFSIHNAM